MRAGKSNPIKHIVSFENFDAYIRATSTNLQVKVTDKMPTIQSNSHTDYFLDITGDVCPMTFVRTKLLIEKMKPGEMAEVRLRNKEPLENVPRSVREIGHEVVSLDPENADEPEDGVHLLVIKKA